MSVATKPVATKPVAINQESTMSVATKPVATKPVATKPVATKPVATKPVATKPVATKPVATNTEAEKLMAVVMADEEEMFTAYAADVAAEAVVQTLDKADSVSADLQNKMVELMTCLSKLSKSSILKHKGLREVFSHGMKGLNRKALILWVEAFTPIRIHMTGNGRLDRIGWSASAVKAAATAGKSVWRLDEAIIESWYSMVDDVQAPAPKAPEYLELVKGLAKGIARRGVALGSVSKAKKEFLEMLAGELDTQLVKYSSSKGFSEWVDKYSQTTTTA